MNRRELLLLAIGIFLTVTTSLILDVYNARTQRSPEKELHLETDKYKIDIEVLNNLEKRPE